MSNDTLYENTLMKSGEKVKILYQRYLKTKNEISFQLTYQMNESSKIANKNCKSAIKTCKSASL